jgi:hypothetical protein
MTTAILSTAIEQAASVAVTDGNSVAEVSEGWTKVKQVVHMRDQLSPTVRQKLAADPRLRYWRTEPTPHNKAEEGFTSDEDKVAISFPRS